MKMMIQLLVVFGIMINTVFGGFSSMSCYSDSGNRNNYDSYHNNVQYSKFLSGMYSTHHNHYEDRLFRWKYCEPNGHNTIQNVAALSQTSYDAQWTRSCSGRNGGYSALVGAVSTHHNHYEDRLWTFYCGNLQGDYYYAAGQCSWTDYVNNFDGEVNYVCPNNGIMRSISSYHSNHHEDRRWRFECCRVSDKQEGVAVPEVYPENPPPFVDPEDYPINDPINYLPNYNDYPYLTWFIGAIFVLVLINCLCSTYNYFISKKGSRSTRYKVVSMHSDEEREDLKL